MAGGVEAGRSAGYPPSSGGSALPVANLSASARWRALGGSEGAHQQLEDGCRWVGGESVEIESGLIQRCSDGSEAGKVTDLNFHFKFVQQISGIEQFAQTLRSLDLSTNNIRTIEGLSGMTKLRELKLYSCQISRIQNLEQCGSLIALHLEDNHIGAIEGLDALHGLEYLNMDSNRVQKMGRGLARLTKLRELHLSKNQLSSLDGLTGLRSLETCSFDHNRLCQITSEQVKGLGKLDELRVAGNLLESLGFLAAGTTKAHPSLPSLVQLDVSSNRLFAGSLRGLPPLQQLTELNLAGNLIEEIEPCLVSSFPTLEILDVGGNKLCRGAEDLAVLKEISSLRELLVQGNPFTSQSEPEHVQEALFALSCLEFVDDKRLERKVEAQVLAIDGGDEDTETFPLTLTKGVSDADKPRPGSGAGSRPTTATSQRPGTASRPGTAQKMSEAGVRDPMMLAKPKMSDKRFASEEQVLHWERQTLNALLATQKQIDKTCFTLDKDLQDMNKFLNKADKTLEREKELCGKRPASPDEFGTSDIPSLRSATVARANAALGEERAAVQADSRVKFRLRSAVEQGRGDDEDEGSDDDLSLPSSQPISPSRLSPAAAAAAACDEEVEEDEPLIEASPVPSSPEPAEEVEEELYGDATGGAAVQTLGPRAARALASATASVAAGGRIPGGPELRVDARAKGRGLAEPRCPVLEARPSPKGSQGRPGSQNSQGQRVRPGAPGRSSYDCSKR